MTPLVSVIMSAYNSEKYVEEAIESILSQTYSNFEFIVINDGSKDRSEELILGFKDPRIVYIKNEVNLGLIASLNKGLEAAKGIYIARIDADDVALPDRLQEQVVAFEADESAIVIGSDYFLLEGEKLRLEKNVNDSDYQKTVLLFATCFAHPTVMMRNVFKETGIRYDKNFLHAEDYRLWTELSFHGRFLNIAKPLLKYRSHPQQISSNSQSIQLKMSEAIRKDYLQKLGFSFTHEELKIHCFIGDNEKFTLKHQLLNAEEWLRSLVRQNEKMKKLNSESFTRAIHKFWIDSCGNTNIGLAAFRIYGDSPLANIYKVSALAKAKLFAKCLIRFFR